jgi:hypothetical protein
MRQISRLLWMIVDQGIFATSNFIMNVLFARWLSASDYGLFAMSFSAYLFFTVIHWGVFLEPLLVLSGRIDASQRRSYIVTLGLAHVFMVVGTLVFSVIGFGVAWAYKDFDMSWAIVGIGGSLMLTLLTARRLCLVFLSPRVSAIVGLTYFLGVIGSGTALGNYSFSWFTLWEIMGFWSLVCSLAIFVLLYRCSVGKTPFPIIQLLMFQRHYAPGAVMAALSQWCSVDGVYLLLGSMVGLAAVAETRAVFNIANPLIQVSSAMHVSSLVLFSEQRKAKKINIIWIVLLYFVATAICVAGSHFAAAPLVRTFYAGRYVDVAWQLPIFVAAVGISGLSLMVTSSFKVRGGLWQGFAPVILSAVVAIGVGFIAMQQNGQPGAVYAIFASAIAALALTGLIFWVAYPQPQEPRCLTIDERCR